MYDRVLTMIRALSSAVFICCLVPPLALAEQVWDEELNRFLTQEELGQEDIYLTADEAARLMFPDSERIRQETLTLTSEQKALVQERIGWHFPETSFEVYIGETNGTRDGFAVLQNTIGKHKPMTYMVGMDSAGEATSVEVLIYRESRGSEVRTKRFNYQYEGKTIYDPIRINRDIINISGATMSVRSMSAGVKRALVLVDEAYLKPVGLGSRHPSARKGQKSFLETLLGF